MPKHNRWPETAKLVKKKMKSERWTRQSLARHLDCTPEFVYKLEHGESKISKVMAYVCEDLSFCTVGEIAKAVAKDVENEYLREV